MKDDLEAIKDAKPSGEVGSPWSGGTAAQHSHTTESELTDHTDDVSDLERMTRPALPAQQS